MHMLYVTFQVVAALMQQPVYVRTGTSLQEKNRESPFQEFFFDFD